MKITTVSFGRTYNDGNFESTRIDLSVELENKDTAESVFQELNTQIKNLREIQLDQPEPSRRVRR